jgi:radical SAM-linked protein
VTGPSDAPEPPRAAEPSGPSDPPAEMPPEPRQRWRVTFGREAPPREEVPTGREYVARWETALLESGLPALVLASGRPRISLGAPLPVGCSGAGELLEFWLTDVRPAWAVREGIEANLPVGHRVVGLESVWLGAPAISGQVAAADYEVALADGLPAGNLDEAVARLLASRTLPRERQKGGVARIHDLRPLVVALEARDAGLRMRTRIHPELGTGRPEEVVAALSDDLGSPLAIERIVRRRLLLLDELVE